eukprot:06864.XXX_399354_397363_1 [CDS] Oithona nana genome sequencing.
MDSNTCQDLFVLYQSGLSYVARKCKEIPHLEVQWKVPPIKLSEGLAGLEAFISYQQRDFLEVNNGTFFYTDSNGLQNVQRQFRTAQKLESNFFPVTTSIFIQERRGRKEQQQRELAILTDRSQAGTSLKEGQISLLLHRKTKYDDKMGLDEALIDASPAS